MSKKLKKFILTIMIGMACIMSLGTNVNANTINGGTYELHTKRDTGYLTFDAHTKVTNGKSTKLVSTAYYLTPVGEPSKVYTVTGTSSSSYIIDQALPSSTASKWTYIYSSHTVGGVNRGITSDGQKVYN